MVKINVKKHLLICTCILGLSTAGALIQSTIHSSSTESNLALNKAVELHITAEQQKQAELNSVGASLLKNSENLQPENEAIELHITADQQKQAELNSVRASMFKNSENLQPENKDVKIHVTAEEQQKIEQIGS